MSWVLCICLWEDTADPKLFRYSLFLVLYPVGIGSEWWLMFQATTAATNWAVLGLYYFFLGLYVPGMCHLGLLVVPVVRC